MTEASSWSHRLPLIAKWTSYILCIITAIEGLILLAGGEIGIFSESALLDGVEDGSKVTLVLTYAFLTAIWIGAGQYFSNLDTSESNSKLWMIPTAIVLLFTTALILDFMALFI